MNIINTSVCLITIGIFDRRRFVVVKLSCMDLAILILKAANIKSAFLSKYVESLFYGLTLFMLPLATISSVMLLECMFPKL